MQKKRAEVLRGDAVPRENRVMLGDLFKLLEANYELRRNRSIDSLRRRRPSEQVEDVYLASPVNLADEADRNVMMQRARAVISSGSG